eukprot:TRINITY_DN3528_c1_g1_i1.p1 TRINITY_DN3528_c1_g1~~TRINITY_DN3528_c1_g1_i1.p1  ORF type:complete len:745 (-),score=144.96 TRINITY_DN3528_c1_g1_i1:534-2486(-)
MAAAATVVSVNATKNNSEFVCNSCHERFKSKPALHQHLRDEPSHTTHHHHHQHPAVGTAAGNAEEFRCGICSKKFKSLSSYHQHLSSKARDDPHHQILLDGFDASEAVGALISPVDNGVMNHSPLPSVLVAAPPVGIVPAPSSLPSVIVQPSGVTSISTSVPNSIIMPATPSYQLHASMLSPINTSPLSSPPLAINPPPQLRKKKSRHDQSGRKRPNNIVLNIEHYMKPSKPVEVSHTQSSGRMGASRKKKNRRQLSSSGSKSHPTSSPEAINRGSLQLGSPNFDSKTADELELHSPQSRAYISDANTSPIARFDSDLNNHLEFTDEGTEEKPLVSNLSNPNISVLTDALEEYASAKAPSQELEEKRLDLLTRLQTTVDQLFDGRVSLELFGSYASGLSSNSSDLDLCLTVVNDPEGKLSGRGLEMLVQLDRRLREEQYGDLFTILSSRVPIVKLTDTRSGIQCDFAVSLQNHRLKSQLLRLFAQCDPRFKKLVLAIKFWSKSRCVGDGSRGALNSFGHTLLIVHYLQICEPPVLPLVELVDSRSHIANSNGSEKKVDDFSWNESLFENFESRNDSPLGQLLFEFFQYYSRSFDPSVHTISTHQRALIENPQRKLSFQERQFTYFCVEDPVDSSDNVGRNMSLVSFMCRV